jgi:hypothetical protein
MANDEDDIVLTDETTLDAKFVAFCKRVKAKRARTVIDHILKYGIITTDDLSSTYRYDHPPRAIGDVRENGIPIITHSVTSKKTGRKIGAYTFGDPKSAIGGRIGGRRAFSKQFKKVLVERYGAREAFTGENLEERYLQIDHRIPYAIAGDGSSHEVEDYMLIDASSQRAKSWSCEHCPNLTGNRDIAVCRICFWAYPNDYKHVATQMKRRLALEWSGNEVIHHDSAEVASKKLGILLQDYIKKLLRE